MERRLAGARHALSLRAERLNGLSPTARLTGGYVFAQDERGRPVASVEQLTVGEPFWLIFSDGRAEVEPVSVRKETAGGNTRATEDARYISTEQYEE